MAFYTIPITSHEPVVITDANALTDLIITKLEGAGAVPNRAHLYPIAEAIAQWLHDRENAMSADGGFTISVP